MDKSEKTIIVIIISLLAGFLCLALACGGVLFAVMRLSPQVVPEVQEQEFRPVLTTPTAIPTLLSPTIETTTEVNSLEALSLAEIPTAELVELAEQYLGKQGIPRQVSTAPVEYELGDRQIFYKLNVDTNETTPIFATLRSKTDKFYFWAEEGIDLDHDSLNRLVDKFTNEIYPINQEFFGEEWIPGVDNDPHLYILYAGDLGFQLAGYTAPSDMVLQAAHEYSNAHEMFYINADVQTLSDPYTYSVMAHEFQHLIHGYHDTNEELWLNEGFSELATILNGYNAGGFDSVFAYNTDMQLNDWSMDPSMNDAHYGASFLYVTYLLDRFGEEITKQIVADPLNGFDSIDHVLAKNNIFDPQTDTLITADDFFMDWAITNMEGFQPTEDARYQYSNYPEAPDARMTENISVCGGSIQTRTVKQYGTDYIEINCSDTPVQLSFFGAEEVAVLPEIVGDSTFMWSNRADSSKTSLTRDFDLSNLSGPVKFSFQTWYDLEEDYDYAYLLASTDGVDWRILRTSTCTMLNPSGNSYGCGYNGNSGKWLNEEVDLSEFAGKVVTLRFEMVTDGAVTGEGLVIDNIQIPELEYAEDFEAGDGGWEELGFVRIKNAIPQGFLISIVSSGGSRPVQKFKVAPGERIEVTLGGLPAYESYILVVSGAARYTRQEADYQFQLINK